MQRIFSIYSIGLWHDIRNPLPDPDIHRDGSLRAFVAILGLMGLCLAVSGCTQFRERLAYVLTADMASPAYNDMEDDGRPGAFDEASQVRQATQDHAYQLAEALRQQQQQAAESQAQSRPEKVPQVHWIDLAPTQATSPAQPTHRIALSEQSASRSEESPASISTRMMFESPSPTVAQRPSQQNRSALLEQLLDQIRSGKGQPIDKALTAAALSLVEPGRALDTADLSSLQPTKQKSVRQYHQLVVSLAQELAARDGELDADTIADHINSIFGQRPISISKVELCRSVRGYGVYEPFENAVFLAGREHTMIVYVELDHFRVNQDAADQRFQVKLAQELVLYNESDGLAVWQQPKVNIVDDSRNRRRDFFVVQMVRLPARLGVGKYLLKIRMTDLHSGSLDELTVPIQLVADQALVGGGIK